MAFSSSSTAKGTAAAPTHSPTHQLPPTHSLTTPLSLPHTTDFENARRYFSKSTTIDHRFAPAWVGFGHAFAAQDESDQAMAAYRTASRLFPGSHIPWLGIGMEYLRTNHLHLALQYIKQAQEICPVEPLVLHELGKGAIARAAAHSNKQPRKTWAVLISA